MNEDQKRSLKQKALSSVLNNFVRGLLRQCETADDIAALSAATVYIGAQVYAEASKSRRVAASCLLHAAQHFDPSVKPEVQVGTWFPKVGDRVRLEVYAMCHDDDDQERHIDPGAVWAVDRLDVLAQKQGLAVTLVTDNGCITVIDQTDMVNGLYPFSPVPA